MLMKNISFPEESNGENNKNLREKEMKSKIAERPISDWYTN